MSCFKALSTGIALAAMICTTAFAQDDQRDLIAKRDKKLAEPFLKSAKWTTSYDEALASARASGKLILGYFTRSYAPCGPCKQLEQTVFSKPDFVEFSGNVVLFCHVSAGLPTEPHNFLFAEKGGRAFPTLMVLDQDGNVLARQCGERSMQAVRQTVSEGQTFSDLVRRAEAGDCGQRYECLCRQVEFGHFSPNTARAKLKDLGSLSADRKAFLEAAIISRECSLALLEIRKAADEAGQFQAAKKLVEMWKAHRVPSDSNVFPFWDWVMSYACHNQDVKLYEDGLIALRALLPKDADTRERLQENEDTLNRMKREVRLGTTGVVSQ